MNDIYLTLHRFEPLGHDVIVQRERTVAAEEFGGNSKWPDRESWVDTYIDRHRPQ